MHVVIFVNVIAKSVVLRGAGTRLTVLSLCVVFATVVSLVRLHTDVLFNELVCGEFVHEVLAMDESTFFVGVFQQNLVKSLDYSLHDFFEAEAHGFFIFVV